MYKGSLDLRKKLKLILQGFPFIVSLLQRHVGRQDDVDLDKVVRIHPNPSVLLKPLTLAAASLHSLRVRAGDIYTGPPCRQLNLTPRRRLTPRHRP
ncbi:hypothetical protein MLD38_002613 [Melastoma candidum]|uniref:Uncharacterized protein n=1 Tax=Melastoma candidum TaxID=119954 RepID=A0ACB9S1F1_9MYRT|nr:hypothetical protein MLD38_002613 [Melastoma candidum]